MGDLQSEGRLTNGRGASLPSGSEREKRDREKEGERGEQRQRTPWCVFGLTFSLTWKAEMKGG